MLAWVIPQCKQWLCPIIDYIWNQVNPTSLDIVPEEVMQFGHTLQWVLQQIAYVNPSIGPVQMMKINLTYGYYCIPLSAQSILQLGVILPTPPGHELLLAFLITLPMRWNKSSPFFCTFTETAANLCNWHLQCGECFPPHMAQGSGQCRQWYLHLAPHFLNPGSATLQPYFPGGPIRHH